MIPTRAVVFWGVVASLVVLACGGPPTAPDDVIYEAGANDEAWLEMTAATPTVDDALAPRLIAPAGAIAVDGPAPTFEWEGGAVADASASRTPPVPAGGAGTFCSRIARELFPIARAHGAPANGPMYRLELGLGGALNPVRVLTGRTRYTPDDAAWARIRVARRDYGVLRLRVELVAAYFMAGRITEGPFARTASPELTLE
jgi:hypothetical protein